MGRKGGGFNEKEFDSRMRSDEIWRKCRAEFGDSKKTTSSSPGAKKVAKREGGQFLSLITHSNGGSV